MRQFIAATGCIAVILGLLVQSLAQAPSVSGRIKGGFQAPTTTDPQGRRSVLKGSDASHLGNRRYEIVSPRVTTFKPDDSLDLVIEAPRCTFDQIKQEAFSDSELFVKTGDEKFSIVGNGWLWQPAESHLVISNNVSAQILKSALASSATNFTSRGTGTNQIINVTATSFDYLANLATFKGKVVVQDGNDRLTCELLKVEFINPGGVQRIEAITNVHLIQTGTEVKSGRAIYDLRDSTLRITENPVWKADQREGSADLLLLNRSNNVLFAEGNVFMKLPVTNVMVTGSTKPSSTNKVMEIHSSKFTYYTPPNTNSAAKAVYKDNVRVLHGAGEIHCNLLTVNFTAQDNRVSKIVAEDNVEIISEKNKAAGSHAVYDAPNEKITLTGDPSWQLEDKTGQSKFIVFYPKTDELLALEDVVITLPASSLGELSFSPAEPKKTSAGRGAMKIYSPVFSHKGDISLFHDNVRVADDAGELSCAMLTVITGTSNQVQQIIAEKNVRIQQPDLLATGDHAHYSVTNGLITLTGSPRVITPERTVDATEFLINRQKNTFSVHGTYRIKMRKESVKKSQASSSKSP